MASPIFLSKPNPSYSLISVFKGIQFALLGIYRLLQNQQLYEEAKNFKFTLLTLELSLVLHVLAYLLKSLMKLGCFIFHKKSDFIVPLIVNNVLNLDLISPLIVYCFYLDRFEDFFLSGLAYIDQVSPTTKRFASLSTHHRIPTDDNGTSSITRFVTSRTRLSNHQTNYLKKLIYDYLNLVLINSFFTLITYSLPDFGNVLISLYISIFCNSKIGTWPSFIVFIFGNIIDPLVYLSLFSSFMMIRITMKCILRYTYFDRLKVYESQLEQWVESRSGLILGFGIVFHFLRIKLAYMSFALLLLQQISSSFLISKVTDPVPDVITEQWLLSQVYWGYVHRRLFVSGDGFMPFPGSFIFSGLDSSEGIDE